MLAPLPAAIFYIQNLLHTIYSENLHKKHQLFLAYAAIDLFSSNSLFPCITRR